MEVHEEDYVEVHEEDYVEVNFEDQVELQNYYIVDCRQRPVHVEENHVDEALFVQPSIGLVKVLCMGRVFHYRQHSLHSESLPSILHEEDVY